MKSITKLLLPICLLFVSLTSQAQVGIGTNTPAASSQLEVSSTTKGFLPPRMNVSQRNAIANPAEGLIIYCTNRGSKGGEPEYYNGFNWMTMLGENVSGDIPTIVSTTAISNVNSSTFSSGGVITSDGGKPITVRGICWSKSTKPIIALTNKTVDGTGIGTFTSNIIDLDLGVTYFIRAYATNTIGTSYGPEISFAVQGPLQVTIGTQVWSANNLNVTKYRNGDIIPEVKDPAVWSGLTTGAWCYYDNDTTKRKLYNWYAINDSRGLAPIGWHIPSNTEWDTLSSILGAQSGNQMKTNYGWPSSDINYNSSGFNGYPNGMRFNDGAFFQSGVSERWWANNEVVSETVNGWVRYLFAYSNNLEVGQALKYWGLSVRCVKD
jgi:uncharacterized protein (TIGR02145 family)